METLGGKTYDVFLSYNRSDEAVAKALVERLGKAGLEIFFDQKDLAGGEEWQKALEAGLAASCVCAVLLGREGQGRWQELEMRTAIAQARAEKGFCILPVLLPGALPPGKGPLQGFLATYQAADLRGGGESEEAFQILLRNVLQVKGELSESREVPAPRVKAGLRGIEEQLKGLETVRKLFGDEETDKKKAQLEAEREALLKIPPVKLRGRAAGAGPSKPPAEGLTAGEEDYLHLLRDKCDQLPLAKDQRSSGDTKPQKRASLANVYVDLQTTERPKLEQVFDRLGVPEKERRKLTGKLQGLAKGHRAAAGPVGEDLGEGTDAQLELLRGGDAEKHPLKPWLPEGMSLEQAFSPVTALEALARHQYLVLLGDPGSGKSTLVNHLAATLAAGLTGDEPDWAEVLEGRFAEPLFPLRVVLRRWSAGLEAAAEVTLEAVHDALAAQAEGLDHERLLARLRDPHTLVLFDGLDEVPAGAGEKEEEKDTLDRRRWVLAAVEKFLTAHGDCRVLVTSRVKPYREGDYQLPDLPVTELAPLDRPRIGRFSEMWYRELERIGGLPRDVSPHDRHERLLAAVRDRPVLAKMAATPLLLTMLARVNARSVLPEGRAHLYDECVEQLLWEWEKEKAEEGAAPSLVALLEEPPRPLGRKQVERALCELTYEAHGKSGKAEVTLSEDELRRAFAALPTFEKRSARRAWAEKVLELIEERSGLLVADGAGGFTFPHRGFQEYLAARWLLEQGDAAATIRKLAEDDIWGEVVLLACGYLGWQSRDTLARAIFTELIEGGEPTDPAGWRRVGLAGQAWWEFEPQWSKGEVGKKLKREIPALLKPLMQHPGLPAAQRLEAGLLLADLGVLPEDLDAWVEISADKLDYPFKIGKYPVTNNQFRRFFDARGYEEDKPWWTEKKELAGHWEERWRKGPRYWGDRKYDRATQPVVAVSWYEAVAYCAWLTENLRAKGEFGDDKEVRLATEEEWVRAAGGAKGTKYPWGNEFDPSRANTEESGLGQPTPVSMYPGGASSEGVFDLAGNVWEWIEDEGKYGRCLKGGAYYMDAGGVGASARDVFSPWSRDDDYGFRCVLVPVSRAQS